MDPREATGCSGEGNQHQCGATDERGEKQAEGERQQDKEQRVATESATTWWQAVKEHEASGGFFSQAAAKQTAKVLGDTESHETRGDNLEVGSKERGEAHQLRFQKAMFRIGLAKSMRRQ